MNRKYEQLRLIEGAEALDQWSATATQAERNSLYEMLFALADSDLLRAYPLVDDEEVGTITIMVRPDLLVCLSFPEPGAFGVQAIGDPYVLVTDGNGAA